MAEQKKNKQGKKYSIDFKYNLKIYGALLKKYKGMIVALLVLILLLETAYLSDRFLFKLVIDNGTNFANHTITSQTLISSMTLIAAIFVIIALLRAIMRWLHMHLINVLDGRLMLDIKKQFPAPPDKLII